MKNIILVSSKDIGNIVICDLCGEDHTFSNAKGGILFGDKACCPVYAPSMEASAKEYHEEEYIKARCPEGKTFKDWCLELRNGNNRVEIFTWK